MLHEGCGVCGSSDPSLCDREPAQDKHGRAPYLLGVSGHPRPSEGGQHALQEAPTDTDTCGDPDGQTCYTAKHNVVYTVGVGITGYFTIRYVIQRFCNNLYMVDSPLTIHHDICLTIV